MSSTTKSGGFCAEESAAIKDRAANRRLSVAGGGPAGRDHAVADEFFAVQPSHHRQNPARRAMMRKQIKPEDQPHGPLGVFVGDEPAGGTFYSGGERATCTFRVDRSHPRPLCGVEVSGDGFP